MDENRLTEEDLVRFREGDGGALRLLMPDGSGGMVWQIVEKFADYYQAWTKEGYRVVREACSPTA